MFLNGKYHRVPSKALPEQKISVHVIYLEAWQKIREVRKTLTLQKIP